MKTFSMAVAVAIWQLFRDASGAASAQREDVPTVDRRPLRQRGCLEIAAQH